MDQAADLRANLGHPDPASNDIGQFVSLPVESVRGVILARQPSTVWRPFAVSKLRWTRTDLSCTPVGACRAGSRCPRIWNPRNSLRLTGRVVTSGGRLSPRLPRFWRVSLRVWHRLRRGSSRLELRSAFAVTQVELHVPDLKPQAEQIHDRMVLEAPDFLPAVGPFTPTVSRGFTLRTEDLPQRNSGALHWLASTRP